MSQTKDYFERIREMQKAIELEKLKIKALELNAYKLGGTNYNRVSSSGNKDFTDSMNRFIDKETEAIQLKEAGLEDYATEIAKASNKLKEMKQIVTGNALIGLYAVELMYVQGMTVKATESALNKNRRVLYEGRRAFFKYCDHRNIFEV